MYEVLGKVAMNKFLKSKYVFTDSEKICLHNTTCGGMIA